MLKSFFGQNDIKIKLILDKKVLLPYKQSKRQGRTC